MRRMIDGKESEYFADLFRPAPWRHNGLCRAPGDHYTEPRSTGQGKRGIPVLLHQLSIVRAGTGFIDNWPVRKRARGMGQFRTHRPL